MFGFEWLALGYTGAFGLVAASGRWPMRRAVPLAVCAAAAGLVLLAPLMPPPVRLVLANVYLVLGYWIPALLVGHRDPLPGVTRFEQWLSQSDEYLRRVCPPVPTPILPLVETAYLACYPVVPASMAVVWAYAGAEAVPRYWTTVLLAGFACYASLPWLVSRPPSKPAPHITGSIARLNALVLKRVSHNWTTFPSGHAAVAWAAAFAVGREWPAAGIALALVAAGISVGAASGRYHYVIDVLLGLLVAVVAAVIT
jgi:hypothetical protein